MSSWNSMTLTESKVVSEVKIDFKNYQLVYRVKLLKKHLMAERTQEGDLAKILLSK